MLLSSSVPASALLCSRTSLLLFHGGRTQLPPSVQTRLALLAGSTAMPACSQPQVCSVTSRWATAAGPVVQYIYKNAFEAVRLS